MKCLSIPFENKPPNTVVYLMEFKCDVIINCLLEYFHFICSENEAYQAMVKFNSRWYAGKQITCQFVKIDRWKNAICGEWEIKARLLCLCVYYSDVYNTVTLVIELWCL